MWPDQLLTSHFRNAASIASFLLKYIFFSITNYFLHHEHHYFIISTVLFLIKDPIGSVLRNNWSAFLKNAFESNVYALYTKH